MLATCHTDGCENVDIPIEVGSLVYTDEETGESYPIPVSCGVCGEPITDVTESVSDGG